LNVVSFLSVVCFFSVERTRAESYIKINNADDQYSSIDEQVKKKNLGDLFYLVIEEQGKHMLANKPRRECVRHVRVPVGRESVLPLVSTVCV
jgi:hypothetical protein